MPRTALGECFQCSKKFSYDLVHNGFNSTSYAYCDRCGCTAFFDRYQTKPREVSVEPFRKIDSNVETNLRSCACGGHFTAKASPRCPHCRNELSAVAATVWIEANA